MESLIEIYLRGMTTPSYVHEQETEVLVVLVYIHFCKGGGG